MSGRKQKICLDLDDGSILRNRVDLLDRLKEHYPDLKLTLFYIPYDYELEMRPDLSVLRPSRLKWLQDRLGWIRLVPHGISHLPREFEHADKQTTLDYLDSIAGEMEKDGLPAVKGFKAPQWLWNQDVVDALDERGWWGAVDRNQTDMLRTKRFYEYNLSTHEPFWMVKKDVWKLHGHMTKPSVNDLESTFMNLMKMPLDAEFLYADELLEEVEDEDSGISE